MDNQYQQKSEVLYTFTPRKSYTYLLNVEPINSVFLKTYKTEFDETAITLTVQIGRSLQIEGQLKVIVEGTNLVNRRNKKLTITNIAPFTPFI